VRCVAPHADMAEQQRRLHTGFDSTAPPRLDDGTPAAVTLYGNASISGGALRLTGRHPGQLGAYVLAPRTRGASHFSARLHVLLGSAVGDADSDGEGGEGLSFCYGSLPAAAFGEMGVPEGLCVRLRTGSSLVMEISCNGSVLASRSMREGTFAQRSGSPLRSGAYLPLDVSRVRHGLRYP